MSKVIAFNINDQIDLQAVVESSISMKQSVILNVSKKAIEFAGYDYLLGLLRVAKSKNPFLFTQLDHAHDIDLIERAIRKHDFDIIMADFSQKPFEENVRLTKQVVDLANQHGVLIEGEIGHVPDSLDDFSEESLTNVEEAQAFAKATNVHYLAVSVGNVHGFGQKQALRNDLIQQIARVTDIPLVLHGADFIAVDEMKEALKRGISKINIGPEIRIPYSTALSEYGPTLSHCRTPDHRVVLQTAKEEMKKTICSLINIVYSEEGVAL
jgi:ketose-bisphosphate aldolase